MIPDQELRYRAFECSFLGEILGRLSDLSEKDQLRLLEIVVREKEDLSVVQFAHNAGVEYVRHFHPDIDSILERSKFVRPGTDINKHLIKDAPVEKKPGFIYLMVNQITKFTKIGFSKNPRFREATLQSQEPQIKLVHKWEGTIKEERDLHDKFNKKRVRGEWFDLSIEDVNSILESVDLEASK